MNLDQHNLSTLILAGGKGSRMKGVDKGLINIGGKYIIEYLVSISSMYSSGVFVNANRNHEEYKKLNCKIIKDILEGYQGPLSGIYSGLLQIKTNYMITLPCDGPFLSDEYFKRMLEKPLNDKIRCAFSNNRLQPVYALIPKKCVNTLKLFLEGGGRKIDKWYKQYGYEVIDFSDMEEMFINVNTEEELLQYKNEIKKRLLG
tara:strand:- start:475 stop:1080 length:606 start_codon:yes stop_codon:yes gene_type:complete